MSTTEDESKEESAEYGLMFKRFKKNKVEIASAITKLFPFLMSLRDHDFISEEKFQISRKKCENPDAVRNEVYDILCDLQKDFSLSLLEVIFSPTHLKAYPDLNETVKIFRDVSNNHRTLHSINGRHAEERPGLPKVVREEGSSSYERMLDGQEPQDDLSSSPLRPQAGAEQSTNDSKMCPCVLCSPARKPEDQEARMGSSQASTVETGNNTTVGKSQGKRNNSRARGQAAVKRRKTKKESRRLCQDCQAQGSEKARRTKCKFQRCLASCDLW